MLKFCTVLAFIAAVVVAMANSYYYDWPMGDEHWHFSYSQRMLHEGVIEREKVHNYISTTPFVAANVWLDEYVTKLGVTAGFDKVSARLPSVGWFVLLLLLSFISAEYLFGEVLTDRNVLVNAGCWAAFLTCLDQTLLGQGSHIGSDTPFAAATLIFLIALESYRRKPSYVTATFVALALGIAFNVKYLATFLLFFALVAMPAIYISQLYRTKSLQPRKLAVILGHFFTIAIILTIIIDSAYGFLEIGQTFADKTWYSTPFKFLASVIPSLPMPWPLPFIAGFDHQLAVERTWSWNVIVLGQHFPNGVWYYFPIVWLLKIPLVMLGTFLLGAVQGIIRWRELKANKAFLLVFFLNAYLLCYFCFIFRTQVGIRYALMCIPLGYLMLAYILSTGLKQHEHRVLSVFLIVGVAFEALPYLGNSLAFTNGILANKSKAYEWITDSNIDWHQNYNRAKAMATAKLGSYQLDPPHLLPGNNVFTINKLAGVMRNFDQYAWIRKNLTPSGNFGGTLIWFEADSQVFKRFLDEDRTRKQPPTFADICPPDRVYRPLENGISTEFGGTWEKPELYTACLKVTEPTVIQLSILQGYGNFGSYPNEYNCQGDEAGKGSLLWFKLEPGIHPICARITEKAKASWTIRQGSAELALRTQ